MDIIIDGLAGNFFGGLEETANIDIVAEIGETRGNNLSSTIVTILTHLSNKDTGIATFFLGESLDNIEGSFELILALFTGLGSGLLTVCTADNIIFGDMTTEYVFECLRDFSNCGSCLGSLNRETKEVLFAGLCGLTDSV